MSTKTLILTVTAIVGLPLVACSNVPEDKAFEESIRRANLSGTTGDAFIRHGRIFWADDELAFRECDMGELYLVDAILSIREPLDQFLQSRTAAYSTAIYLRFHGEVIANVDGLPDRYEDVVQINELLSYDASVPVVCK